MSTLRRAVARAVAPELQRLPPEWTGYRWVRRESLRAHLARVAAAGSPVDFQVLHPRDVAANPLPENVTTRTALPSDRGWWGFSFRDVPERTNGETLLARLQGCAVVTARVGRNGKDFLPAILSSDHRAIEMREVHWRRQHGTVLQSSRPRQLERATWILERVYENHAHWLTAHLPKLLVLRARGQLDEVLLPTERSATMDASLRWLGMDPEGFQLHDMAQPLQVRSLTVLNTDRFRPELLRLVQDAFTAGAPDPAPPSDRIFISRSRATWRRLANEERVWPMLRRHGFERVAPETLSFAEQVQVMNRAAVVVAPHGAGLANVLFCQPGTRIVEIADLKVPSPNFYALAAALRHRYWIVEASGVGDREQLYRDLEVDPTRLTQAVEAAVST